MGGKAICHHTAKAETTTRQTRTNSAASALQSSCQRRTLDKETNGLLCQKS